MAKVVVIGNLSVVINALKVMRDCKSCEIELVISHPSLRGIGDFVRIWCDEHGIPYSGDGDINSAEVVDRISEIAPDYIFSIYNPTIMKAPLLATPAKGTINFHAGPLPTYRGIYTFSWAIINGEKEYGVAWHLVDEDIDTGEVLFQRRFEISADETALSLSQKSFDVGVCLLKERLRALIDGTLAPEGTPAGAANYYGRKNIPNGGRVDFSWPFEQIDRFVRGLNYYPAPNPFVMATSAFSGTTFYPLKVVRASPPACSICVPEPGQVVAVDAHQIIVQAQDGLLGIKELLDDKRRKKDPVEFAKELDLRPGAVLA